MTSKKTKELQRRLRENAKPIATKEEMEEYFELFLFFYDELVDLNDRRRGVSPLNKECYNLIKRRYESGEYPENLKWLAEKELQLELKDK